MYVYNHVSYLSVVNKNVSNLEARGKQIIYSNSAFESVIVTCSGKQTQNDDADSGVQFITPAGLLQEGGLLPGPETGLLSNTRK